jgi:uncharacterized protein
MPIAPAPSYGSFATRAPAHAVPSPCVSVCLMDAKTGLCQGCLRTLDEIAAWSSAGDALKRDIWARLDARRAQADHPPPAPISSTPSKPAG